MASDDKKLILGIDIGTTSVKVCVIDPVTEKVLSKQSKDTQANVPSDLGCEGNKQDVPKIISALNFCVSRLPKDLLREVTTNKKKVKISQLYFINKFFSQ